MCDNRIGYGYAGLLNEDDCVCCVLQTKKNKTRNILKHIDIAEKKESA